MYRNDRLTKAIAERIRDAEGMVIEDYEETVVEHEPQITDRLLAYIQAMFHNQIIGGVSWKAKTLTSQGGANSQEPRFGADFMGVLNLNMPGYQVKKGFFAQAKRIEPGQKVSKSTHDELIAQCDKMLNVTPMSYVFIYSMQSGIRVASAIDVASSQLCNPLDLTTISLPEFFKRHVECHIGDRRMSSATAKGLVELAEEFGIRTTSVLSGSSLEKDRYV